MKTLGKLYCAQCGKLKSYMTVKLSESTGPGVSILKEANGV